MADTTQYYTVVTPEGEQSIAGNTTYIVDRFVPIYDFRLDSNLDTRFLRSQRKSNEENLVKYMTTEWSQVYPNNLPLSDTDVFLWNPKSLLTSWTYSIASSFIGEGQGGFSIGDIEINGTSGLLQPETVIGTPTSSLNGLACYTLGDIIYDSSAASGVENKYFNKNLFIANSNSPDENSVRIIDDNGLFPDDDAFLYTDGGYTEPVSIIDTASYFNGSTGDYTITEEQAIEICYNNISSYQTVFTDAGGTLTPGFRFNIKFGQDVGTIKFNKVILYAINTQFNPVTGTCEKVGDYFPFAVTVLPITQLKTNVVGHGIEEFNLNAQIIISRSAYTNNNLVLDNCSWTKLDKYQGLAGTSSDDCVSALPGCGPNAAVLAWDKNVYIGTPSIDLYQNKEAEIAKLLISDGGPFVTYDSDIASTGGIVDLQKPQLALGNKNLGENTIDGNRSYWMYSYIGENTAADSHDLILFPKNTQEQYLSGDEVIYDSDGTPIGVDKTNAVYIDHPTTQAVVPNTSWLLLGSNQSTVNIDKLSPAISFGKEGKIFNEYYGSSVRVNQLRSLPTSDFLANNIFIHNLATLSTGWPDASLMPSYNANDLVIVAKNNVVLDGVQITIPDAPLSVNKIIGLSELASGNTYLNPTPLIKNTDGISFDDLVYVDETDNYVAVSLTSLNLKGREINPATSAEQYSTDIKLNFQVDGDFSNSVQYSVVGRELYNGVVISPETTASLNMGATDPYVDIYGLRNLYAVDENKFFDHPMAGIQFVEKSFTPDVETDQRDGIITHFMKSKWTENDVVQVDHTLGISFEPNAYNEYVSNPGIIMSTEVNIVPEYDTTKINLIDAGVISFKDTGLIVAPDEITIKAFSNSAELNLYSTVIYDTAPIDAITHSAHFGLYSKFSENSVIQSEKNVGVDFIPVGYYDDYTDPSNPTVVLLDEVDIKPDSTTSKINLINLGMINSQDDVVIYANDAKNSIEMTKSVLVTDSNTQATLYSTTLTSSAVWVENSAEVADITTGISLVTNMNYLPSSVPGVVYDNELNIIPTDTTTAINIYGVGILGNAYNELSNIQFFEDVISTDVLLGTLTNYSTKISTYSSYENVSGVVVEETLPSIIIEAASTWDASTYESLENYVTIRPDDNTLGINLVGIHSATFTGDISFKTDGFVYLSGWNDTVSFGLTETILFQDTTTDAKQYIAELKLKSTFYENNILVQEEIVGIEFVPAGEQQPLSNPGIFLYNEIDIRAATGTDKINIVDVGYISGVNLDRVYEDTSIGDYLDCYNTRIISTSVYSDGVNPYSETNTVGLDISANSYYNYDSSLPVLDDQVVIKAAPGTLGIVLQDVSYIQHYSTLVIDAPIVSIPNLVITGLAVDSILGTNGYIETSTEFGLEIVNTVLNSSVPEADIIIRSDMGDISLDARAVYITGLLHVDNVVGGFGYLSFDSGIEQGTKLVGYNGVDISTVGGTPSADITVTVEGGQYINHVMVGYAAIKTGSASISSADSGDIILASSDDIFIEANAEIVLNSATGRIRFANLPTTAQPGGNLWLDSNGFLRIS